MEFLLDCGVSKEILQKVIVNNSNQTLLNANWNIERVVSSLEYLNEIGIKQINNILINRFDIVLRGKKNLKEKFDELGIKKTVNMINKDMQYINILDQY